MISKEKNIVDLVFALFDDSKYFLNNAKIKESNSSSAETYSRASILVAWAAFEGWVNKTCNDFAETDKKLSSGEIGFLLEKKVELRKGQFVVSGADKYENIENKIDFLLKKFVGYSIDKSKSYWSDFQASKNIRDTLVHPKKHKSINIGIKEAELNLKTLQYFIKLLSNKLYNNNLKY